MSKAELSSNQTGETPMNDDVWLHSACEMCYSSCGILVHRVNGVVVKIEGDPECPHNLGKQCAKGQAAIMTLYDPNRVKTPLKRTNPQKGIGVDPKWEAISWEEALNIVCERLKKVRNDDPSRLIVSEWDGSWGFLTKAWQLAFGRREPTNLATAARCGAGLHSVTYLVNGTFHNDVDLEYCNYCILWGSQMGFLAGLGPMPMARKMAEARARGMKLVVIDPRCSTPAAKADEWIPIRPGTDGAMALAMLNVLLNELGIYDREFIKRHTNGCYLIGLDGRYVRDKENGKPLVWDSVESKAKTFDAEVKDYALEGSYSVDGVECRPAFQLLKEQVKKYTPEQVSSITTVSAATIRRIAQEFGEAAKIGSKIVIQDKELPYRPAGIIYYKGIVARKQATWQELSILLLNLAVGSFYAPGGYSGINLFGPSGRWEPRQSKDGLVVPADKITHFDPYAPRTESPLGGIGNLLTLGDGPGQMRFYSIADSEKYQLAVKPEVAIICRTNWAQARENKEDAARPLLNIPFVISFATVLDETAEFADVVLPDTACMERLVPFPNSRQQTHIMPATGHFYWGMAHPLLRPAGEARHWCQVLVEIADRMGFLDDLNSRVNLAISNTAYKLEPNKKYSIEEITDRVAKSEFGSDHGLKWFAEHGYLRVGRSVEESYPIADLKPRVPMYCEHFVQGTEEVKKTIEERHITWWDMSDYAALPSWRPSPAYARRLSTEYNLFCINYTDPLTFKTITPENAWLNEVAERHFRLHRIEVSAEAAKKRGIKDGDLIWVESVAGKVKGKARVTECIHPEVVAIGGTFGSWAKGKPIARGKGVHHNSLIPVSDDRIDVLSGAIEDCIEVKVYKAKEQDV
ncbi:MAG: molybdopterin-dependent oxidoreductase [Chloroflexi bacterium]|nr:molybdopterin-dependent oxidoreductase [Chloroflexota bacterium]